MPGPACCLLAAYLSSAAVVEAAAGADAEVAAGRAPIDPVSPEENSITLTLVPGAGLRVRSATNALTLAYTPRIFYRVPNALEVDRPLVLHQVTFEDTFELSRRLTWTSSAELSLGEIDYTASNLVFAPGSSAVRVSVADIARGEANTGLSLNITKRLRWTLDANGEYTTPLGDGGNLSDGTLPDGTTLPEGVTIPNGVLFGGVLESAQASVASSISYALNRSDRVAANLEVTYQWFPDTGRFLLFSPDLSWERQLDRSTSFSLSGGIAYVVTLETPAGGLQRSDEFGATGGFEVASVLYKARQTSVTGSINTTLDWFFDPVAGTSQPRAGIDVGSEILIGRDWQITPNGSFYAVLRDRGSGVGPTLGGAAPDLQAQIIDTNSTVLRAEIPFRYSITRAVQFVFGGRGSLRGNSITGDAFQLDRIVELWAFAGLAVRFASGRDYGTWLTLGDSEFGLRESANARRSTGQQVEEPDPLPQPKPATPASPSTTPTSTQPSTQPRAQPEPDEPGAP